MAIYQPKPTGKRFKDHEGSRFARLVVVGYVGREAGTNHQLWECRCDCGKTTVCRANSLQTGNMQSCGCLRLEKASRVNYRHGHSPANGSSSEYDSYHHMKNRCLNPADSRYGSYGGRGITICDRWLGNDGFKNFIDDLGRMPGEHYSIERDDVDGNYCPSNCRWIQLSKQSQNKRDTVRLSANGRTMLIAEWAKETNLPVRTIKGRLYRGWTVHDALFLPLQRVRSAG